MISQLPEFDNHHSIHFFHDQSVQLHAIIAIHRNNILTPSFGATRLWKFESEEAALKDALRLSKLMTSKSASAGLRYGGAKAVIIEPTEPYDRKKLLKAYARAVDSLQGKFITGTDVGLYQEDVLHMRKFSRFFVGTRVDPTEYTAIGVIMALEALNTEIFGTDLLQNRSFAIQGLGKIGSKLVEMLSPLAEKIYASEIDQEKSTKAKQRFSNLILVSPEEIHKQKVDYFIPCALSHVINESTIEELQCKGIAGAANNQLSSADLSKQLDKKDILYAPDYVANGGGLISVVHEYENPVIKKEQLIRDVKNIKNKIQTIFQEQKKTSGTSVEAAEKIAEMHAAIFSTQFL